MKFLAVRGVTLWHVARRKAKNCGQHLDCIVFHVSASDVGICVQPQWPRDERTRILAVWMRLERGELCCELPDGGPRQN